MRSPGMLVLVVALMAVPAAVADIPPPPPPGTSAKLEIVVDPRAEEPRLVMPRNLANQNAALDPLRDDQFTDVEEPHGPQGGTLLAGVSLALAASAAGLWLVRRSRTGPGMALLLVGAIGVVGSAVVYANAPPPRPQPPTQLYSGKVAVEYVAEGNTIRLILPPRATRGAADSEAPGTAPKPTPRK